MHFVAMNVLSLSISVRPLLEHTATKPPATGALAKILVGLWVGVYATCLIASATYTLGTAIIPTSTEIACYHV